MKTTIEMLTVLGFTCALVAQDSPARPAPDSPRQLIKDLELPTKRLAAIEALQAIGGPAAMDLAQALADPRPEIAFTAKRLPDGSTLIATYSSHVQVVTREGETLRKHMLPASVYVAHLLPGGDILLGTSAGLFRLDDQGRTKWKFEAESAGSIEVY